MNSLQRRSYLVGIGIGILSWIVFVVVNTPIGITTALSEISGAAAMPIVGAEAVQTNPYWAKSMPQWNYGTLFLIGTFIGALLSSLTSKSFRLELIPIVWKEKFGSSYLPRIISAFLGGIIVMYGARLAGGCTSGHGISGSLQLALSSWVFFIVMFITALVTARLMFSKKEGAK
ncbi:MAG: YeeE/YedE family protein [SAR324 cluster bacterium]|uniref:YeeE/YedE family protein n=1 Tax=SAR324 cluster bacterium TaxID=2024889 RepID=A0A7X9FUA9_9DELT|nr:YeeE/YedE family protein [SAR324 cluster bacterium]